MPTNDHMQDDPNLVLPPAVRAQIERTNAIISQVNQPQQEEGEGEGEQQLPAELDPANLAASQQGQEPQQEEGEGEGEQQPQQQPQPDEATWEHRYNSLMGRYKTQEKTIRQMNDQIVGLQNVLASMQNVQISDAPEVKVEKLLSPEEESEYGADLLQVVGKRAREELAPIVSAQAKQIEELKNMVMSLGGTVQAKGQQELNATLDARLPEWRELNRNEEFLSWLALPDAYSGAIRHDMLKAAYAQGDANRVLAFFNGFLQEEAATKPAGEQQPDPPTRQRVAKVPLGSLAAPGKAKTAAATPAPAEKPIFTRAHIAKFYADVAAGQYRGRDDDKNAIERAIFAAQAEGRIR